MRILTIIPARSGSKGLPGKNLRPLAGKPFMVHSIDVTRARPSISEVVVTSDSEEIGNVALTHGAIFVRRPNDTDLGMGVEKRDLLLESMGKGNVVSVHAGDENALSSSKGDVERFRQAKVGCVGEEANAIVMPCELLENSVRPIRRRIIHDEQLKITVRLRKDVQHRVADKPLAVMDG